MKDEWGGRSSGCLFSFGLNIVLEIIGIDILGIIVSLALFIPSLALGTRRLHDTGKSGWWQLLWIIPIIGWIVIIVFLAQETSPADNQFGAPAQPKILGGSVPVAPVVAPEVTDVRVVRDAEVVTDKHPE